MNHVKPWVTSLQIETDEYTSWIDSKQSHENVTFWALINHKIPTEAYLSWARKYYGLASFKSPFFDQAGSIETWNLMKNVSHWSQEMIPVYFWDNVVYIACIEVPMGDDAQILNTWNFEYQFVLAAPSDLQKYWTKLQNTASSKAKPTEPKVITILDEEVETSSPSLSNPPPEPITQVTLHDSVLKREDSPKIPDIPPPILAEETEGTTETPEAPEGLSILPSAKPQSIEPTLLLHEDEIEKDIDDTDHSEEETRIEMPAGLKPLPIDTKGEPEKNHSESFNNNTLSGITSINVGKAKEATNEESIIQDDPTPPIPLEAMEPVNTPAVSPTREIPDGHSVFDASEDLTTPLTSDEEPLVQHADLPYIQNSDSAPAALNQAKTELQVANFFFNEAASKFDSLMILLKEGAHMKPWQWHGKWADLSADQIKTIPLADPSIFRIVERTKLPFYGPISPSEINDKFLKHWGHEHFEGTAIVCAVAYDGFLVGMALALNHSTTYSSDLNILKVTERSVEEMAMALQRISKAA